jgi:phage terminase large subunit-like protein
MSEPATFRTRGPNVAKFFSTYLHHTKGAQAGKPFVFEPWQQEFVNEFYRVDERGNRVYRLGILGIPRGNGKSPMAGGFGIYELMSRKDSPDVFCAAASKEQAGVVQGFARDFVDGGPLRELGVKAFKRSITFEPTGGAMKVISSEGSLQHGLNPSAAIADELHAFKTEAQEETWIAMWTALHKRPNAFGLVITTSGYDKNTLLGKMYDQALDLPGEDPTPCLRIRRDLENGVLFYWYGIPEALHGEWENEELWTLANPASWIKTSELRKQLNAPGVDELDFKRLHLNMWTKSRDSWLPPGLWPSLRSDESIPRGADIYIGVDVGWYHDSTAVAWASRLPDGRIAIRAKVWTTQEEQLGQFVSGGKMELELVEDFIRSLRQRYRIREVAYDPAYFGRSASLLEKQYAIRPMIEMLPSSATTIEAWQGFYQAASEGILSHDGDVVLASHVESAAADKTERGLRVRKLKSTSRIDALAAAVLAHARCELKTRPGNKPQIRFFDPFE